MTKIWMLAVVLLAIINAVKAQNTAADSQSNKKQNSTSNKSPFKVTKGYYSIYRNEEKLNRQPLNVVVRNTAYDYPKGFYAIGNHYTQLQKAGKSFIMTNKKQPFATKGYYSIKPLAIGNSEETLFIESVDTKKIVQEGN